MKKSCFSFGHIPIIGNLVLAPMDGFSDQPFRWLCRRMGSSISYTEFINVCDVPNKLNNLLTRICFTESERPVGFQLYGSDPDKILRAAQILSEYKPDFFDINLGCSVRRIAGRGAGAGLLRFPHKIEEIIKSLTKHLHIPISVKIRLGWDGDHQNYKEVSRIIEGSGASMIAVHARSRNQSWLEPANWEAIRAIKQSVQIPIIGNGDVRTLTDVDRMIAETGCDKVMIGRAAIGNPWIFSSVDKKTLPRDEIIKVIHLHWNLMMSFYGVQRSVDLFKKHLKAYLSTPQFSHMDIKRLISSENPMRRILQDI